MDRAIPELMRSMRWRKHLLVTLVLLSSCGHLLSVDAYKEAGERFLEDVDGFRLKILSGDEKEQQASGRALEETSRPTLTIYGPGSRSISKVPFGEAGPSGCSKLDFSHFKRGRECGSPLSLPCFDYKRCRPSSEGNVLRVYVYDEDCSLSASKDMPSFYTPTAPVDCAVRQVARELGILAETYESACLFIHVRKQAWGVHNLCAPFAPSWNHGANHLMIDLTDETRASRRVIADSYAMEASTNTRTCFYRSGFDIPLPLTPKVIFPHLAKIPATDRKYFLTFKGALYLVRSGSEERMSLLSLRDEDNGVIISAHCFAAHKRDRLTDNVRPCQRLQNRYNDHGYDELMNTTFALVPAGRSPGTYRLGEVMSAGAIPVFVARDYVRPFREQFDWPSFSFMFSPEQVEIMMMATLRAVSPDKLVEMQINSLKAFHEMFGGNRTTSTMRISQRVLSILEERVGFK